MTHRYVYALLTALVFGSFIAEGNEKAIDDLLGMIQTLQNRMEAFDEETKQLREDKLSLLEELRKTNAKQQVFERWMNDRQMDASTLFLATISAASIPIADGDPIVWDSALINPGGHFSTVLGSYTAPVNGYYQFSVTKQGFDYYGSFNLLVDEVRYAHNWLLLSPDSTGNPTGSTTINMELTAGQVVRVENLGSTEVYGTDSTGYIRSWFTGHLLYVV